MKKWLLILFSGLLPGIIVSAQVKSAQQMLKEGGIRPTKVMLVGSFHFSYPNRDQHKISKKDMRDIFSEKSQKELDELLDVMRIYQPTRIYLESDDQQYLDSSYAAFTDETLLKQASERVQIGFRLARERKLSKVYAVDAGTFINDLNNADSVMLGKVLGSDSVMDTRHADSLNRIYSRFYSYADSLCATLPLLKAFAYMNEPRNLQLGLGAYLSGYFNTATNYGPDFLASWWVDRNLRIFHNVLMTTPAPDDRILILFGAGHIPLLTNYFMASPDFEVVDFYKAALKQMKS